MNYILEVYSHGMFIPITGSASFQTNSDVVLEFGIDDHFNNPEWMTTNVYKIESTGLTPPAMLGNAGIQGDAKVQAFLVDAKRDIMTHLDATGFFTAQA